MKRFLVLPLLVAAGPAFAHTGHLSAEAGHSHWVALAATLAAIVIVIAGILRSLAARRRQTAND